MDCIEGLNNSTCKISFEEYAELIIQNANEQEDDEVVLWGFEEEEDVALL